MCHEVSRAGDRRHPDVSAVLPCWGGLTPPQVRRHSTQSPAGQSPHIQRTWSRASMAAQQAQGKPTSQGLVTTTQRANETHCLPFTKHSIPTALGSAETRTSRHLPRVRERWKVTLGAGTRLGSARAATAYQPDATVRGTGSLNCPDRATRDTGRK